jgi:hypothetical protein
LDMALVLPREMLTDLRRCTVRHRDSEAADFYGECKVKIVK